MKIKNAVELVNLMNNIKELSHEIAERDITEVEHIESIIRLSGWINNDANKLLKSVKEDKDVL